MSAILRIKHAAALQYDAAGNAQPRDPLKGYVDRVVKLIPAEVVSVYLAGKSGIQAAFPPGSDANRTTTLISENQYWVGWTVFCLASVVLVRAWATSDKGKGLKPEWPAVAIAAVSFVIWVYSLGDVFARPSLFGNLEHGIWEPLLSSLFVLAWTLVVPLLYKE